MYYVVFMNGVVLAFFGVLMGVTALFFHSTAGVFLLAGLLTSFLGMMLAIVSYRPDMEMERLDAFVMTSTVWMTGAIAGGVPLWMWGLTPIDALFEAMSGITTTGSTVMSGLDHTPRGIICWRALLQGVGGVGFVVTAIAVLPILKVGGMQLFRTESSDKGEKELRNAAVFASATLQVYIGLIAVCAFVYMAGGMNFFDGVTHAMTTLSTGGYSGYDASFAHFESPFLQWAGTIFMLLGALPFAWYIRILNRGMFYSEQVSAMLWSLAVVILVLSFWLVATSEMPFTTALRLVAFNVVSVVTTTGYADTDYTQWGQFFVMAFFFLTAVGGCTGSTAGGAKAMRWLLAWRAVVAKFQNVQSQNRVTSIKYEGRAVDEDVLNGVVVFFVFYFATFVVMTIILALLGLDLETATSSALTALANVGPGVGSIVGPSGNFATLSDPVKFVLTIGMYLGRLEMLTVLILFTPMFWQEYAVATRPAHRVSR
ncbi:TrkH family potassium uptake protein [Donghicola sp. C2-DW-16]|uniref:Trk system potassium uptake protein n=1 Tax=Donghicola mangrovi TaxID=2729614 RepID=A0ABX2PDH3_9RHOB|nr:TrkH family potassium uptake protein [Donghicola mangrovi]NVO27510.1 TrkH family potassium uptake protein [Donghicola mangrovi]